MGLESPETTKAVRPSLARRQAAWAHDVQATEHIRMLHSDTRCAVAAHRVADQPAAQPIWKRPVMRVDVGHQVTRNKLLEVSSGNLTPIHGPVVQSLRVGQH
jgi:hypothetical protein